VNKMNLRRSPRLAAKRKLEGGISPIFQKPVKAPPLNESFVGKIFRKIREGFSPKTRFNAKEAARNDEYEQVRYRKRPQVSEPLRELASENIAEAIQEELESVVKIPVQVLENVVANVEATAKLEPVKPLKKKYNPNTFTGHSPVLYARQQKRNENTGTLRAGKMRKW
jgi:hypothetical protein